MKIRVENLGVLKEAEFSLGDLTMLSGLVKRITVDMELCGGRPCIRGMRIRVCDILEMLANKVTINEILEDFPDLELEDIYACLMFASQITTIPQLTL